MIPYDLSPMYFSLFQFFCQRVDAMTFVLMSWVYDLE